MDQLRLGNVMIDCGDAPRLCRFYHELLGWEESVLFGLPAVRNEKGFVFLFAEEEGYIAPTWPEEAGKQQKQMHFDFQVPNVNAAVERALSLGATKASSQFGNGEFITLFDPAGHPFCLCAQGNAP